MHACKILTTSAAAAASIPSCITRNSHLSAKTAVVPIDMLGGLGCHLVERLDTCLMRGKPKCRRLSKPWSPVPARWTTRSVSEAGP